MNGNTAALLSSAVTAAPLETSTTVADALPPPAMTLPTMTPPTPAAMATPSTLFVKLNLI
jgi:hypothetical protein